jgi:bifunctional non-homologous end joining protein LigD
VVRRAATPGPQRLARYRAKRDFEATPEPAGGRAQGRRRTGPRFVVQKHAARRLHYDFRLEHGGVLLSWAVPKGPSEVPGDKRLAVRTEDHPLSYADFEGRIPAGEYGAGKVEIWDRGVWRPPADVERALAKGHLDFRLEGGKLRGGWHLVRMGGGLSDPGEKANWLLIKGSDEASRPQRVAAPAPRMTSKSRRPEARLEFQLATLVERPPAGDAWLHEIKWDGYRLLLARRGTRVRALTRGGQDWSDRFPTLVQAARDLPVDGLVLDGEAVVLRRGGRSDFHALQRALSTGRAEQVAFAAFDLLELDGEDLSGLALETRRIACARCSPTPPAAARCCSAPTRWVAATSAWRAPAGRVSRGSSASAAASPIVPAAAATGRRASAAGGRSS